MSLDKLNAKRLEMPGVIGFSHRNARRVDVIKTRFDRLDHALKNYQNDTKGLLNEMAKYEELSRNIKDILKRAEKFLENVLNCDSAGSLNRTHASMQVDSQPGQFLIIISLSSTLLAILYRYKF